MVAVLHCVFMLICLTTLSSSTSFNQTLQLLSILPYPPRPLAPNPSYSEGPTLFLASQLAVDRVNNRTDLLPGYHLELVRGNGGCEVQGEVEIALFEHVLYNENNVHAQGMIGPGCSHSTLRVGNLTRRPQLSLLSVSLAGTTALEDESGVFRNTFSILDSSQQFVNAIKKISKDQNWKNIIVHYDLSRKIFTTVADKLRQVATESSLDLMFVGLFPNFTSISLSDLQLQCQPHSRIVIFLAGEELVRDILCLLIREHDFLDVVYPNFQFIIINHTPQSLTQNVTLTYDDTARKCSSEEMRSRLNGTILLQYRLDPLNKNETTDSGLSYNEFDEMYNKSIEIYNNQSKLTEQVEWSDFGAPYFDATWALILALNNSREELRERTGLELWQYRYGHANATDIVRNHLLQLDFMGVSGEIKFNETSGFVERLVDIWQFKNGSAQRLAYYNGSSNTISNDKPEFITDNFDYYPDRDVALGIVLISLIVVITAVIVFVHIVSLANKNQPSIKATHPKLYQFAYLGIYLEAIGAILYVIGSSFGIQADQRCPVVQAAAVIGDTGIVLLFVTLTAISYRVYRIFVHYMHPGNWIGDLYLIAFIVTATSAFSLLFTILQVTAFKSTGMQKCSKTEGSVVSGPVDCVFVHLSEATTAGMILMRTIPELILALSAAICVTKSIGHVKMELFKTNPIIIVCYLFFASAGIWILYYALEITSDVGIADTAGLGPAIGFTFSNQITCLVFLFFPPVAPIIKAFYNFHVKENAVSFWQRAKDCMSKQACHKSKLIASSDHECDEDTDSSSMRVHGHYRHSCFAEDLNICRSRSATGQKDSPASSPGSGTLQEVQVTIEVVEESRR